MKLSDIITQLQIMLPMFTDKFSEKFSVSSLTSSGSTISGTTATDHNFQVNEFVHILGALTPNNINSLTQIDNIATAITDDQHDLTENWQDTVEIIGTNEADYNGEKALLTVPNRKTFTYQISGNPSSPATGSPLLLYNYIFGYNGWNQLTAVTNNTFQYESTQPERMTRSPAYGNIDVFGRTRVSGAVSIDKAIQSYTSQPTDNYWAFVIMEDTAANKDRKEYTDATTTVGKGTVFRQLIITPFSVYVFAPTVTTISARIQQDDMADDILKAICSSLLRLRLPSGFDEVTYSGAVFTGHGFYDFNDAYYIHRYTFETTAYVTYGDTISPDYNVAFRDIELNFKNFFNSENEDIMDTTVDLDEEQLT